MLVTFCEACSLVSVLFSCLGLAFKFAELEYVAKLQDLLEASKSHQTLLHVLDFDIMNDTVKTQGSHTRNLRRVRQGIDLVRTMFENSISSNDNSLKEPDQTADKMMRRYIRASAPVIEYIDSLYVSRRISLDW
ncbi:hypothetical protein MLD38_004396 [Melastoma candidum]|uniref:Uncharacterized protein n=1 Tax=Melastoma candidum TaxID=119954 RepID=A0ACB9S6D9_9MYRT|nr:hypothetical protein MLD38_004396 [Melastoma candidum]